MGNSFELIKEWTKKHRPQVEPDHQVERYAWFRDTVKGQILSIGCGEAKVEEYIYIRDNGECDYAVPVCGADFNQEFLHSARRRWPNGTFVHYNICDTGTRLNFGDNSFDTVVLGDVIEHVPPYYLHRLISDSLRVCKPGGQVLISTPNGSFFGDNNSCSIYSSDHVIVMTPEVFKNIIDPPADSKEWWIRDGRARHQFKYTYEMKISNFPRFIFCSLKNNKEV